MRRVLLTQKRVSFPSVYGEEGAASVSRARRQTRTHLAVLLPHSRVRRHTITPFIYLHAVLI